MPHSIKEKVRELEKSNRLITENLIDAVWVVDAKSLVYEYITPSIRDISGYAAEELINTPIIGRLTPESLRKAIQSLSRELEQFDRGNPATRTLELEIRHRDGGTYWVEIRAKLTREPGNPPKIIGVTREITNQKKAELRLQALNQELIDALADKERLLKEVKILQKLLPICSGCRRIRDTAGKWWPLDEYVRAHTDSTFTHTICPDCTAIFYPGHDAPP